MNHTAPRTTIEKSLSDGRDVFVIRVEIDVATMNESVHTTMREEVARAVRTIVASKVATEKMHARVDPFVDRVLKEEEPAIVALAKDYVARHAHERIERMVDTTIGRALAQFTRRLLGREESTVAPTEPA